MDAYQHHGWRVGTACNTLTAGQNDTVRGDTPPVVHAYDIGGARLRNPSEYVELSPTITARCGTGTTGFDGYNGALTGTVSSMLGVNCGVSTGRNGIIYALQANGIDRADTAGFNGAGWREDQCYTLNTIDRHAVCYLASGKQTVGTLMANAATKLWLGNQEVFSGDYTVIQPARPPRKYIVRRLTPVECARLQGFPDWWCAGLETPEPTEEDIAWAAEVWERWRLITNPNTKPKSRNQLIKWLKTPHSDAAEYKLWGNGIALPCAVRVMEGIVKEEEP